MRARGDSNQVRPGSLLPVDCSDELIKDIGIFLVLAEAYYINVDLLLLKLFGQFHNLFLVRVDRRPSIFNNNIRNFWKFLLTYPTKAMILVL